MPTILVVDDHHLVTRVAAAVLHDLGHHVVTAGDGEEGERVFVEANPDLVITDLYMPKCDGLQLLTRVRERNPDVKVIVMTGTSSFDASGRLSVEMALARGANLTLAKPFLPSELTAAVARALAQ